MLNQREIEIVERLIRLHDGKSYRVLQEISVPPKDPADDGKITEDLYIQMCNDIETDMGNIEKIEPIDVLLRSDSKLALCRVKYSKSDFMAFWGICFELETLKIQDVMVQW